MPRPLNNFEPGRFSFEPLGESASAYSTSDDTTVSSYPLPSASLYGDPRETRAGRMNLECPSTCHTPSPDILRSAFHPSGSGMPGVAHPHIRHGAYMEPGAMAARDEDQLSSSGFSPGRNWRMPYYYSHSLDHQSGVDLQSMMNHQRLMERGVLGGVASKRDSSTDDEMSVYESDTKVPKYRKTEPPERSLYAFNQRPSRRGSRVDGGGGMWDFKTRGHARKGHIPIGRVSPITPTETERAAMASMYSHQHVKASVKVSLM